MPVTAGQTHSSRRHGRRRATIPRPPGQSQTSWYNHPCFRRYWQHYHSVMSWSRTQLYCQRQAENFYNWTHRLRGVTHHQTRNVQSNVQSRRRVRRRVEQEDDADSDNDIDISMDSDLVEDEESDLEMHVTDEMMEFFTKSHQHRMERDAARVNTGEDSKKEENRIDLASASVQKTKAEVTTEAPKERPGIRRTAEMKELYGKQAAMIHGMETAVQMTFDRNCDVKQPKLWPIMPFNIQFEAK